MKYGFATALALIVGLTVAACQPRAPETGADDDREAPDFAAMNEAYDAAMNAGDAVEWGTYRFAGMLRESDVTVTEEGKYVAIWKQQPDGSWQIVRDIWNSNSPQAMEDENDAE